jgi:signal transduction histidine kinase
MRGFIAYLIIYSLFIFFDYSIKPELFWSFFTLRIAIDFPILCIPIIITYTKKLKNYFVIFATLAATVPILSKIILFIILIKTDFGISLIYFSGIIMMMSIMGLLIHKWKVNAVAASFIVFFYYLMIMINIPKMLLESCFIPIFIFLIVTAIVSTIISYFFQMLNINNFVKEKKMLAVNMEILMKNKIIEAQKEELAENIKLKDKFFSIIAHDLRSPFSGIMGLTDLMANDIESMTMDEIKMIADSLNKASNKTFQLLNELLDWARLQTGSVPFFPKVQNLTELINSVIILHRPVAKNKNVTIENISGNDIFAFFDFSLISTVIRNLISNAIKYSNEKGIITITAKQVNDEVIVCFNDTGIGISNDNKIKLFKIDNHISTIGTANETGTGLGLILCKEIIEKHNGKIWLESTQGVGSTFYFSLPTKEI